MARHRRLNKNLVTVLTISGIILSVAIVAVLAFQAARKDPEVYAAEARKAEQEDPLRAVRLYVKAYEVERQVKYLVEAARVAYQMGEIGQAFRMLGRANAERPDNVAVLSVLLERLWALRSYEPARAWTMMRDYSDKILRLDRDHVLGLLCRAAALKGLADQDPEYPRLAAEALQHATEVAPDDPRVAMMRVQRLLEQAAELRRQIGHGTAPADVESQIQQYYEQARRIAQPAWEANPADRELSAAYARVLGLLGQPDEARTVAEKALAARPEDVDLQVALARRLLSEAGRKRGELSAERLNALLDRAAGYVKQALGAEPALFEGYVLQAQIKLFRAAAGGAAGEQMAEQYRAALDIYRGALQKTVDLESIRVALGMGAKVQMLYEAFLTAVSYYHHSVQELQGAAGDKHRAAALEYARSFQERVAAEFPTSFLNPLLEGELALLKEGFGADDARAAIRAFVQVEEQTRGLNRHFNRQACERLARLYRQVGEFGSALHYSEQAIESYLNEGREAPRQLWANKVQLLNQLLRYQEALDLAERLLRQYPADAALRDLRVAALIGLGRKPEASKLLAAAPARTARELLNQARLAAAAGDYGSAEADLRKVLDAEPGNVEAIRLYVHVMLAAERRDQARRYLQTLAPKVGPEYQHVLRGLEVVLSTPDLKQRRAKLLEIVRQIPDPVARAGELYNYYVTQKPPLYDKALPYLDELEKARRDQEGYEAVLDQQFAIRLLLGQQEQAERYAVLLAQRNADGAHGAVYRGRLALARKDTAEALREFRAAARDLPGNSELQVYIARALLAAAPPRLEEALEPLREALRANPRHFLANKLMFAVLSRLGRSEEATPYLELAAQLNPTDPFVRQRMEFLQEERDPQAGIARRQKLREGEPDNVDNLVRLAELCAKPAVGDDARAEQYLRAALKLDPGHARAAFVAARHFARRKQRQAGESLLRRHIAALSGVRQLEGRMLLARFLEELGDAAAARDTYLQAEGLVDRLVADQNERRNVHAAIMVKLVEFYRRSGQMAPLLEAAQRALSLLEPDDKGRIQQVRLAVAEGLLGTQQYGKAREEIDRYLADFPGEPRGLTVKAQALMAAGDPGSLQEARELLSRVLRDDPENARCLLLRGSISAQLGRYDEAHQDLLKAKQLSPEGLNLAHRRNLALLYETIQRYELAEAEWRALCELQPQKKEFPQSLVRLYRVSDQPVKARAVVAQAMSRQPEDPFWPGLMARLLSEERQFSAAADYLETAVKLSKRSVPRYLAEWIRALTRAKRAPEAVRVFEGLAPEQISPMVRTNASQAYFALGKVELANRCVLEAARQAAREGLRPLTLVCQRLVEATSLSKAVELLRHLMAESAADPLPGLRLRVVLASLLIEQKQPGEALRVLEPALAQAATASPERVAALLSRARALELSGDADGMIQTYERVLAQDANNIHALNNLAYALADRFKRPREALVYAQRARQVGASSATLLDTIGWVYSLNDRDAQAESILREALRLDPRDLAARYHLGLVYKKLGRTREARTALSRVVEQARAAGNAAYEQKAARVLQELH